MPIYEMRKFVSPEFIFGAGCRWRVSTYARNLGAQRALIVTDAGVLAAGWVKDVQSELNHAGIETVVFHALSPNPRDHEVMAGAMVYAQQRCDVIIAVGGGSVMDCAKSIGIVDANQRNILEFEGVDQVDAPGPPLICIPTTAGTGADISQFCIILNTERRYKMSIISKTMVPDVALIDPETTTTMDAWLTACTGLDAMTHAIEAYVSTACSPVVDAHALAAVNLAFNNLEHAVNDPTNLAARENMMLASLHAGLAFSNASLGAVHAMSHSLGGYYDMPHGECNGLLLEHVLRFNMHEGLGRYGKIGEAMGIDARGMVEKQQAARIIEEITALRQRIGIAGSLAARGVRSADIPDLAVNAKTDACLVTNPKRANLADLTVIYADAL